MEDLKDHLKNHKYKEGSFLLCNIAGLEWQMLKDGEIFSSSLDGESNNMIAINNNDGVGDNEMLKKKVVAILREKIHNSVRSMNELSEKSGYEGFEITYEEIVEMLKLKSYELIKQENYTNGKMEKWEKEKEEIKKLALAIKGSTREEFPADLVDLEDYIYKTYVKN